MIAGRSSIPVLLPLVLGCGTDPSSEGDEEECEEDEFEVADWYLSTDRYEYIVELASYYGIGPGDEAWCAAVCADAIGSLYFYLNPIYGPINIEACSLDPLDGYTAFVESVTCSGFTGQC